MHRVRHTSRALEQRARELRREATPAEMVLWEALRAGRLDGLKFRRQHPVGRFILDFHCAGSRLCIELDGDVHKDPQQRDRDMARDASVFAHGVKTPRFTNAQLFQDLPAVLAMIRAAARPRW